MKNKEQFMNDAEDIRNTIDKTTEELKFASYTIDLEQLSRKEIADFILRMISTVEMSRGLLNNKIDHLEQKHGNTKKQFINDAEDIRDTIDKTTEELKFASYEINLEQLSREEIAGFILGMISTVEMSRGLLNDKIDHLEQEYENDDTMFDTWSNLCDYIVEALGNFTSDFFA